MKKNKLKLKKWVLVFPLLLIIIIIAFIVYANVHGMYTNLKIKINGDSNVKLEVGSEYKDKGIMATYNKKSIKDITTKGKVDNKKIGTYKIKYIVKYKKVKKTATRIVKVVDTTSPEISIGAETVNLLVGNDYTEFGFSASDNYDGDITSKVTSTNNIDKNTVGTYEVNYEVSDSSGNKSSAKRTVNVINTLPSNGKVAVLNYHFFFDPNEEYCGDGNCEDVNEFRRQLDYLRDNNFKTLTMQEFRNWMYGVIEIPEKSVLITVDDGAKGTGIHNGNKLIPILEEYKMHATLFLITGWWDIGNYQSPYLDIESHTNDMHTERYCEGVTRGAKMLCLSRDEVLNDLKKSIEIT
ncbi:MAG: DUF5011 domain-containing protein, partial [Bacilli bacterium]|nr:DUF5011 domain-containing protein [Bacilli bacterium]